MKKQRKVSEDFGGARREPRCQPIGDLHISYEGGGDEITIHLPDISLHGIFLTTTMHFPEGAVLNLRFRLTRSDIEVHTRGEVRYCLPGIGIGVEFIGLDPVTMEAIAEEISALSPPHPVKS